MFYIAFKASHELTRTTDQLLYNLEHAEHKGNARLAADMSHLMIDSGVYEFVERIFEQMEIRPIGKNIINGLLKVVTGTARLLINRTIAKQHDPQIANLDDYIRKHRLVIDDIHYVAFQIPEELGNEMKDIFTRVNTGEYKGQKIRLGTAMAQVTDIMLDCFLHEPMDKLKLGTLTGKLVDGSYHTFKKAADSATPKLIGGMTYEELAVSAKLFEEHLKEV